MNKLTQNLFQMSNDLSKKKTELQKLIQSMQEISQNKLKIQSEIQNAIKNKQFMIIFQKKKSLAHAFLGELKLENYKEKINSYENKSQNDFNKEIINMKEITEKINSLFDKLKTHDFDNADQKVVFNISHNAARAEFFEINKKFKRTSNLNLNIEGFDAILLKNYLYIIGGLDPTTNLYQRTTNMFDLNSLTISEMSLKPDKKADLNIERMAHTLQTVFRRYIYCMGGYNSTLKYLRQCEKYDTKLNQWFLIPSMNEYKAQLTSCCLEEKYLFIFGGNLGPSKSIKTIELLELQREFEGWKIIKFTNPVEIWPGSYNSAVLPISSHQILLFGGMQNKETLNNVFVFDKSQTAILKMTNKLPNSGASFYQRKPILFAGEIYATTAQNEFWIGKSEIADVQWEKSKIIFDE